MVSDPILEVNAGDPQELPHAQRMHLFDRAIGLPDADRELRGDVGDGEEAGFRRGRGDGCVGANGVGAIGVFDLVGVGVSVDARRRWRRDAAHQSTADTREAARTEATKRARHAGAEGRYCDDDMDDSYKPMTSKLRTKESVARLRGRS